MKSLNKVIANKFMFFFCCNINHMWNRRKLNFAILQRQHVCTAQFPLQTFYLVLMVNFNPHQFTNLHYSPGYSQYGDGLLSPFGLQIFSQDSLPSTLQPSFDRAFEHRQPIQPSTVPSAASGEAKKSDQRERWSFARETLSLTVWFQISFMSRTCDLQNSCGVNVATYLWDNLWRDIKKIRPQCDPCQWQLFVSGWGQVVYTKFKQMFKEFRK